MSMANQEFLSYAQRTELLRQTKEQQAEEKRGIYGGDDILVIQDRGLIVPLDDYHFTPEPNQPSGAFSGPLGCGENFRRLLEVHPIYIDPVSTLAGGYMENFSWLRNTNGQPDFPIEHLQADHQLYNLYHGIGGPQHLNPDMRIGLRLGWQGILDQIHRYRAQHGPDHHDFYDGLEAVVLGIQNWISRHADAAQAAAAVHSDPILKQNLEKMATINRKLVTEAPETFHEACQWVAWFILVAVMYNGSGAAGAIDDFLKPFYERDIAEGRLEAEEAIFHLECLLMKDDAYYQVGGTDPEGNDLTNPLSFHMLEAEHRLKIPAHVTVRVHDKQDPELLKLAVRYLFEDKTGEPSFIGDKALNEGFIRNGFPMELARQRDKCGCHWLGIPGREYTLNDIIKINLAKVFEVALREMMGDETTEPSVANLMNRYEGHLRRAVQVIAEGIDIHVEHMHEVFPELVIDLLCYGPIEKGVDLSHGSLEYNNFGVDGTGIAIVADSLAALEQRVEKEGRFTWTQVMHYLDTDFADAEDVRLTLHNIPRYGNGRSRADEYAVVLSQMFTHLVKENPTPNGYIMIPGLFSHLQTVPMGAAVGATPNGRHAFTPLSQGANPDPGFTAATSPTGLSSAIAAVQCGYGNPAPVQMEVDPVLSTGEAGIEKMTALIKGMFDIGNTHLNITILDRKTIMEAHLNPSTHPDLIVRVTGFCAYFANLSPVIRQMIVDRIMEG